MGCGRDAAGEDNPRPEWMESDTVQGGSRKDGEDAIGTNDGECKSLSEHIPSESDQELNSGEDI